MTPKSLPSDSPTNSATVEWIDSCIETLIIDCVEWLSSPVKSYESSSLPFSLSFSKLFSSSESSVDEALESESSGCFARDGFFPVVGYNKDSFEEVQRGVGNNNNDNVPSELELLDLKDKSIFGDDDVAFVMVPQLEPPPPEPPPEPPPTEPPPPPAPLSTYPMVFHRDPTLVTCRWKVLIPRSSNGENSSETSMLVSDVVSRMSGSEYEDKQVESQGVSEAFGAKLICRRHLC